MAHQLLLDLNSLREVAVTRYEVIQKLRETVAEKERKYNDVFMEKEAIFKAYKAVREELLLMKMEKDLLDDAVRHPY